MEGIVGIPAGALQEGEAKENSGPAGRSKKESPAADSGGAEEGRIRRLASTGAQYGHGAPTLLPCLLRCFSVF